MFYGGGDDLLQAQSWQLVENTPSRSTVSFTSTSSSFTEKRVQNVTKPELPEVPLITAQKLAASVSIPRRHKWNLRLKVS